MKKITLVVTGMILFTGCATILNEDLQRVNISSRADKIEGTIDGVPFQGPGIVPVKRSKSDKIIVVDTPSCTNETILRSSTDPKVFFNILSGYGSTTGTVIDYASEKMWEDQDQVISPCK